LNNDIKRSFFQLRGIPPKIIAGKNSVAEYLWRRKEKRIFKRNPMY
jgi:hypothetical protein